MDSVVRIYSTGGADVLTLGDVERRELAPNEAWIEQEAVGVKLYGIIDTTVRYSNNNAGDNNLAELTDGYFNGSRWDMRGTGVADYSLSKRTDIYAEVDFNRVNGAYALPALMGVKGSKVGGGIGLRHRF